MTDDKFDVAPAIACPFCDSYRARVEKAEAEVAALNHDIARHIKIAADLATENEELRERIRALLSETGGEPCVY